MFCFPISPTFFLPVPLLLSNGFVVVLAHLPGPSVYQQAASAAGLHGLSFVSGRSLASSLLPVITPRSGLHAPSNRKALTPPAHIELHPVSLACFPNGILEVLPSQAHFLSGIYVLFLLYRDGNLASEPRSVFLGSSLFMFSPRLCWQPACVCM